MICPNAIMCKGRYDSSDERYAPWPDVITIQFFCGPSARHQFNGITISSFLTDSNVMAIFLRAFGPQSIQWQYNFHFLSDNNVMAIFSGPFAHHQHNINFFVICAEKINLARGHINWTPGVRPTLSTTTSTASRWWSSQDYLQPAETI